MKIGVLALQGGVAEHLAVLSRLGVASLAVRRPTQLDEIDGLIIPGGESTVIGKLATHAGLIEPLRRFGQRRAIWGTCAGAIFLSKDAHRSQPLLELMDISVARNAFGSQAHSFAVDIDVPALYQNGNRLPFHAVFIRAPLIESVRGRAVALATLRDGRIVAAREGRWLATSFHPELTTDDRFHRYFLSLAA